MEKITVQTTGDFALLDPISGEFIPHDGTTTVPHTDFITERLYSKQLEVPPADDAPPPQRGRRR
jgi:hypothetical protein